MNECSFCHKEAAKICGNCYWNGIEKISEHVRKIVHKELLEYQEAKDKQKLEEIIRIVKAAIISIFAEYGRLPQEKEKN